MVHVLVREMAMSNTHMGKKCWDGDVIYFWAFEKTEAQL